MPILSPYDTPEQYRHIPTQKKAVKNLQEGEIARYNQKSKTGFLISNTRSRFNTRYNTVHFDKYDLHTDGVTSSKPMVNYAKEIDARKNAPYLIGLEIEIEAKNTRDSDESDDEENDVINDPLLTETKLSALATALNTYLPISTYVCTDGSLNDGCEIVTAPRTLQEIKQSYHNYYKLLKTLRRSGYQSHDSGQCGLHMHISKKAMSYEKWQSLQKTLIRYQTFFKALSRRQGNFRFCRFSSSNNRYVALNTENCDTNEFRFFRGTLKPESFLASLEIMLSLVEHWRTCEKPTFSKWRKELAKWKFGHAYALPHMPTRQAIIRVTEEERLAKKHAREQKKHERDMRLLELLINVRRNVAHQLGTLGADQAQIGDVIGEKCFPLRIHGYTKQLRDYALRTNPTVTITGIARILDKYSADYKVIATQSSGWGRTSTYARLSDRC